LGTDTMMCLTPATMFNMKTELIGIRVEPEVRTELEARAAVEGLSISELVREVLVTGCVQLAVGRDEAIPGSGEAGELHG
jgi:hypothetical protein